MVEECRRGPSRSDVDPLIIHSGGRLVKAGATSPSTSCWDEVEKMTALAVTGAGGGWGGGTRRSEVSRGQRVIPKTNLGYLFLTHAK